MALATFDTRDIQISSIYFRKDSTEARFESYPRQLVYGGREYRLVEKFGN